MDFRGISFSEKTTGKPDKRPSNNLENLVIIDVREIGCLSLESREWSLNIKGRSL